MLLPPLPLDSVIVRLTSAEEWGPCLPRDRASFHAQLWTCSISSVTSSHLSFSSSKSLLKRADLKEKFNEKDQGSQLLENRQHTPYTFLSSATLWKYLLLNSSRMNKAALWTIDWWTILCGCAHKRRQNFFGVVTRVDTIPIQPSSNWAKSKILIPTKCNTDQLSQCLLPKGRSTVHWQHLHQTWSSPYCTNTAAG